ncbi:MAG TPA: hypothetical protein VG456_25665 [Candidatus Sulfopaludibacter sp.]|nr:hypothetical protein [Candidatus Sulfopaludibacter sp.]
MKIVKRTLLILLLVLAAGYLADYLAARTRPTGSVQVQPILAIPQKDGKDEFILQDPETDSCVQSLLPHLNQQPCWYLEKHKQRRIDM